MRCIWLNCKIPMNSNIFIDLAIISFFRKKYSTNSIDSVESMKLNLKFFGPHTVPDLIQWKHPQIYSLNTFTNGKVCQMSKSGLLRKFIENNLTQWDSHILKSILICHIGVCLTQNPQNIYKIYLNQFWWLSYGTSKLMPLYVNLIVQTKYCEPPPWFS